jgi:hypothetical protein
MPAGAVGASWATNSWEATAWEANSWAGIETGSAAGPQRGAQNRGRNRTRLWWLVFLVGLGDLWR